MIDEAKFFELMSKQELLIKRLEDSIDKDNNSILNVKEMPDNQDCGNVCYTRLYKTDEAIMDEVCKSTGRKKAAVIRILVHEGLKRGLINARD